MTTKSTTQAATMSAAQAGARADVLPAALAALALGGLLLFMVGFSHAAEIHNAAHDTRHALSFPCH